MLHYMISITLQPLDYHNIIIEEERKKIVKEKNITKINQNITVGIIIIIETKSKEIDGCLL